MAHEWCKFGVHESRPQYCIDFGCPDELSTCEFFGDTRPIKPGVTVTYQIGDESRTLKICEFHENVIETMDPDLYAVGFTLRGDVEMRFWPAIPIATEDGPQPPNGVPGLSAYEVAVANGFVGTEAEWLESLVGADGDPGSSAYQVAVANGFVGTEAEWLESLVGADGDPSTVPGPPGSSAYQVAVANGFVGTEAEWLESLVGDPGAPGASASYWGYRASNTLSGNPGTSRVAWNNASQVDATIVRLHHINLEGFDVDLILESLVIGDSLVIQDANVHGNSQKWMISNTPIENYVSATEVYWDFPVTLVSSEGSGTTGFPNNHELAVVVFVRGPEGPPGSSAYQVAVANGFVGTEAEWLESLVGADGDPGPEILFIQDTEPTPEQTAGLPKWAWVNTLDDPPTFWVEDGMVG